jgi:nucleotide-binding universal stress UspA family protein
MKILLTADRSAAVEKNVRILSQFEFPANTEYALAEIGGGDRKRRGSPPEGQSVRQALEASGISYQVVSLETSTEDELLDVVSEGCYDLVVDLRERRRTPLLRFRQTCSRFAQLVDTTLLLAHPAPVEISKVLLCSGGEATSEVTIKAARNWLKLLDAEIHLLHVMSQVPLDYAHSDEDLQVDAEAAIDHETREGVHLKHGMQWLKEAGVTRDIIPVLRHGLVLDEIIDEIKEGGYDLVVVGAHLRVKNRLLNLLLEDITDQLLASVRVPFLIIRIHSADQEQAPEGS